VLVAPQQFETLDEAFYWINRSFLTRPHEYVQFIRGSQGFCEDLVIPVKRPVTTLNLYEYAFNPKTKWKHLVRTYIDPDEYYRFWEQMGKVTGTSYQFRFKNKLSGNGPCLIAVVLKRNESGALWTRASIIWRTAELQRKFAADLVLIHNFFREAPEECKQLMDIQEVVLYLSQAFQSWRLVGPLVKRFCSWEEVDTSHDYGKRVVSNFQRIYAEPQPELKFAPAIKMQKFYLKQKRGELGHCTPEDLSLVKALEEIKRGR